MTLRQAACFIGHGAPSLLAREDDRTGAWLRHFGPSLRNASTRGVVCISAHGVTPRLVVTTAEHPPCEPAPDGLSPPGRIAGSKTLARRVIEHLLAGGHAVVGDEGRGLDHGVWSPFARLFPELDLPVVQLSLHASLDPELHLALGRALEPLRDEGILILGSGGLTDEPVTEASGPLSAPGARFQAWVVDLLTRNGPYARGRGLTRFRDHPDAHRVQPTGEHILPLLVVAGAATSDRSQENVGEIVHAGAQHGLSMAALVFRR